MTTFLTVVVLVVVGARLVSGARAAFSPAGRATTSTIVRGLRWHHVVPVPFVLAAVVAVALVVMRLPGMDIGWWTALGGEGNPVTGGTEATGGTVWAWLVPVVFLVLLVPALPLFAFTEERVFREGAETWSVPRRIAKVLQFGLVHVLIGIPIGAALALSVGGAYFMARYLRTVRQTGQPRLGVLESTRSHLAYNAVILSVVLVATVAAALP